MTYHQPTPELSPLNPQPPHSTEAEESVLGSLLIDPEALSAVADFLSPADFYHPRHRVIYDAIVALQARGMAADFVTVSHELERTGCLEGVGGDSCLANLCTGVVTSINVVSYAHIVERTALYRRLISAAGRIAATGYQDPPDPDQVLREATAEIQRLGLRRSAGGFLPLGDLVEGYLRQIPCGEPAPPAMTPVPTGLRDLDRFLGGLHRGNLIILAARPSHGKTSLGLTIARNVAVTFAETVGIFSLEMSGFELAERLLTAEADVDSRRLREGRITELELRPIDAAFTTLRQAQIYIDDTPALPIAELRRRAQQLHAEHPLDLLIVDYLQLVEPSFRGDNRAVAVSEISRALKALARDFNVPVLALAQLSRAVEQRSPHIPQLSDLRESGNIEQDADVVIFIYREVVYDRHSERPDLAELHIAKHRNGPTGQVNLGFIRERSQFVDLALVPATRELGR